MTDAKEKKPLALIVDDEPDIRELLEITLARMDVDSRSAGTVDDALAAIRQECDRGWWDVAVVDVFVTMILEDA